MEAVSIEDEEFSIGSASYYRKFFGFDPERDRVVKDTINGPHFVYERQFPLHQDPLLQAAGVCIVARVTFKKNERVQNRIVFKTKDHESSVKCVHTAIYSISTRDIEHLFEEPGENFSEKAVDLARSTERREIELSPEDHFASLLSYVQGIAEYGILHLVLASYYSEKNNPLTLPFGFNSALQIQIFGALNCVAPELMAQLVKDTILEIVEIVPAEWFTARFYLLDRIYHFKSLLFSDWNFFHLLEEKIGSESKFYHHVLREPENCHPKIVEHAYGNFLDSLPPNEASILKQLNTLIGFKLFVLSSSSNLRSGFMLEKGHIVKIWLRNLDLIKFPTFLGQLSRLKILDLSDCRITVLPSLGDEFPALEVLELCGNPIQSISTLPPSIAKIEGQRFRAAGVRRKKEIEFLVAVKILSGKILKSKSRFRKESTGFSTLGGRINILYLSNLKLSILPPGLVNLEHLFALSIRNNSISALPPGFGGMKNMQFLDLSRNKFQDFPPEITRLDHLGTLDISDNQIRELPETLGNLSTLRTFQMAGNLLSDAPVSIGQMKYLTHLNLAQNHLRALPSTFGSLESLKTLNLKGNEIAELPWSFHRLITLKSLDLQQNMLEELPEELVTLQNLKFLDISRNRLASLPRFIIRLKKIEEIRVDGRFEHDLALKPFKKLYELPQNELFIDTPTRRYVILPRSVLLGNASSRDLELIRESLPDSLVRIIALELVRFYKQIRENTTPREFGSLQGLVLHGANLFLFLHFLKYDIARIIVLMLKESPESDFIDFVASILTIMTSYDNFKVEYVSMLEKCRRWGASSLIVEQLMDPLFFPIGSMERAQFIEKLRESASIFKQEQ